MVRCFPNLLAAAAAVLLLGSLSSCGQGVHRFAAARSTAKQAAGSGRVESPSPPFPNDDAHGGATATIAFVLGNVRRCVSGRWLTAEVGDTLRAGDRLRVGHASRCEIAFGQLAVARLDAGSDVTLTSLVLGRNTAVRFELTAGAVLSHVRALGAADLYQVMTAGTVAGVRGTDFRVRITPDSKTQIAVREGSVAVIPRSALAPLHARLAEVDARGLEASAAALAPRVGSNQSLLVASKDAAATDESFEQIRKLVTQGAPASLVEALLETAMARFAESLAKPAPLTRSERHALDEALRTQMSRSAGLVPLSLRPPIQRSVTSRW